MSYIATRSSGGVVVVVDFGGCVGAVVCDLPDVALEPRS